MSSNNNWNGDVVIENPFFLAWKRQDNYVLLTLFGTCSPEAQIVMSSATSSAGAMSRVTKVYTNRSRTQIMSLKEHLSSITKGDSNVYDYLHSIHSVTDELVLIGHFVDDLDLVIMALKGLGYAYHEFCAVISTCDTPLLFDELFDKLVDYGIFLQREEPSFPFTANHVSHLSLLAVTNVQCHPLVKHLLLGTALLVLIHVILPLDLPLFINIVIVVVTLLRLATNYMVILQIILVIKQIRLIRILAPNHIDFWILIHLVMSPKILLNSL